MEKDEVLRAVAEELRTIAAFGLNFARDPYSVERFEGVSAETTAVDFFASDQLPALSPGHHLRVPYIFKQLRGEAEIPFFTMTTRHENDNITILTGAVADQTALRGLLNQIWDFNLALIAIERLD